MSNLLDGANGNPLYCVIYGGSHLLSVSGEREERRADMCAKAVSLPRDVASKFESRLIGTVTWPHSPDYDTARAVWNGMIDRYPAMIVHCKTTDDVIASIRFARDHDLPVAVRGGGHSVAGHGTCDDGVVVDLSPMKEIDVDPDLRVARAGGGVTWAELDAATQEHGLATPGGVFSDTGIAGLTLGGGFGWLRNKHGLSCDNLIGATVVTAAGKVVHTSEQENRDLLWGLRGGGGNFGVVTSFEFSLHPIGPEVYFAFVFHDGEGDNMTRALRYFVDYVDGAPEESTLIAACGRIPPEEEVFPREIHGRWFVLMGGLYAGSAKDGERALKPLIDFGPPLADVSGTMPYVEAQQVFDEEYPEGMRYYWKSINLTHIDDDAIDRIANHAGRMASPLTTTDIWPIGGAVKRVSPEDSAFGGRQAQYMLNLESNWEDPADDDANIGWAREFIEAMKEYSDGGLYLNFAGFQEEGDGMMRSAFGRQHERLAMLKAKYDPDNVFQINQNIKPAP